MSDARSVVRNLLEQKQQPVSSVPGYPEAGLNAPGPVKEVIREFQRLPQEVQDRKPLLYYLLGSGTNAYKMSQPASQYTDESQREGQTCGNCEFAYQKVATEAYFCSQIQGQIVPPGWCKLWAGAEQVGPMEPEGDPEL